MSHCACICVLYGLERRAEASARFRFRRGEARRGEVRLSVGLVATCSSRICVAANCVNVVVICWVRSLVKGKG